MHLSGQLCQTGTLKVQCLPPSHLDTGLRSCLCEKKLKIITSCSCSIRLLNQPLSILSGKIARPCVEPGATNIAKIKSPIGGTYTSTGRGQAHGWSQYKTIPCPGLISMDVWGCACDPQMGAKQWSQREGVWKELLLVMKSNEPCKCCLSPR